MNKKLLWILFAVCSVLSVSAQSVKVKRVMIDIEKQTLVLVDSVKQAAKYNSAAVAPRTIEKGALKKETDPAKKQGLINEAKDNLKYNLKYISTKDQQSKELLKSLE